MFGRNDTPPLLVLVATALLCLVTKGAIGIAQEKSPGEKSAGEQAPRDDKKSARPPRAGNNGSMPAFTPEREAAAMKFVREHHPEVADLLDNLRAARPEQYRRAARELFRTSERVAQWKERDAARYDLELKLWKINSRIQLLTARSTMSPDMDVEAELKSLLAERVDTRLALRRLDREQLAKRLAAADADIARLSADKEASVERQLDQVRQNVHANRRRVDASRSKKADKPAAEKKSPKDKPKGEAKATK